MTVNPSHSFAVVISLISLDFQGFFRTDCHHDIWGLSCWSPVCWFRSTQPLNLSGRRHLDWTKKVHV